MKKYLNLVLVSIFLYSCGGTTSVPTTGETKKTSQQVGTITINSKGYGQKEESAIIHAKEQAFVNLLFRGIPNSSFSNRGMVGNEQKSRNENSDYFAKFFDNGYYNRFIIESKQTQLFNKKEKSVICDVKINVKALRKDLQQNQVIRGFGL